MTQTRTRRSLVQVQAGPLKNFNNKACRVDEWFSRGFSYFLNEITGSLH